ncbi:hypothetical protein [Sporosarcina sp. SAFN-015]|uniref:hypothetical protein n=1 Tax=Sporosarcina sp. SAFN-015 TaxID=3387274 RepID=UPI003F811BB3
MIPWRLQFTGIRDYGSEEMLLDQANEHILITGPNGAGKSTISFCMGAVLRSSKVDIEGLKSQNLRTDETWRAAIHLLFKNEGISRVDAPPFIEFRLLIEQAPNELLKLRYEIHDGDEIDELELRQAFRSGDAKKNNFTAYKRELEFKYKVHPDLYYLIWYQQEVNQFSVMAPEERFRIFSEMHKIDQIQKDWETSLEVVKEARDAYQTASSQQKFNEMELDIARNKRDRYENNKKRLDEHGKSYAFTTHHLQLTTMKEMEEAEKYIEDRKFEQEELAEEVQHNTLELERVRGQRRDSEARQSEQHNQLKLSEEQLSLEEEKEEKILEEVSALQNELSELKNAYAKLPYTESETKEKMTNANEKVKHLEMDEQEVEKDLKAVAGRINVNRQKYAEVNAAVQQWDEKRKQSEKWIERYISSHQLKQDIIGLAEGLEMTKDLKTAKEKELRKLEEEFSMLTQNRVESERQTQAIHHLKQHGIRAYPLRHFIKLQDHLPIESERLFDAIKYTVFYEAASCKPINDLYHVSLEKLVPDRSIITLPQYGLEMQENLSVHEQNQAARVLWWMERLFDPDYPDLQKGLLIDRIGSRGPQEQNTYILSKRALTERRQTLERRINELRNDIQQLTEQFETDNDQYRVWNADVQKVIDAEAFLSTKADQQYRLDQLRSLADEHAELERRKTELENQKDALWKDKYKEEELIKSLEEYMLVYEQFGKQSEKIQRLQEQEQQLLQLAQNVQAIRRSIQAINRNLNEIQGILQKYKREETDIEDKLVATKRVLAQIENQIRDKEDEKNALLGRYLDYEKEMLELTQLIPDLVRKALQEEQTEVSKYDLQMHKTQAKVEFENARNEKDIDPNAVENYRTLEQEFQRKKEELQSARSLLEENEERAIINEQRLETAIQMQVTKINLLFQEYMGEFQFEGQIKYEKVTDKKGRPIFKLFIYVRKEGHRGKFEDVSLKARGGRVGKGVSGGEESLSSLLFALSLLQNLENQAGFIVLDEFDSALDEKRKSTVFELYANKLQRKLIILSPKAHEDEYYHQFSKAFIVSHDPKEVSSKIRGIKIAE